MREERAARSGSRNPRDGATVHPKRESTRPVARFWGSGVLADHRHQGIYGALVLSRGRDAVARGAEVVLVTARTGTSGPIRKRPQFRAVGSVRVFQSHW
jgi:hypothetical protein